MSNNCRPALDTRPIVVVIQVMERGAIRDYRISGANLPTFMVETTLEATAHYPLLRTVKYRTLLRLEQTVMGTQRF